ncbi:MAG: pilus assembly protein N-terminal domain-containing protein, partial [Prevotella sp.]|nr:pilus assembly protein N-terminal domain-containing protein [Prevotella sp.]
MKKHSHFLFLFIAMLITTAFFIGCGNDDEPETVEPVDLIIERNKVSLTPGKSLTVKITGGNGGYKAISSNDKVAKATISEDIITITATSTEDKANGMIIIEDKMYKRVTIDVEVVKEYDLVLKSNSADLILGEKDKDEAIVYIETGNFGYNIDMMGNASQYIQIDQTNLETAGKFTVKAIASGTANIKITDAMGKEALFEVNISNAPTLEVDKSSLEIKSTQGEALITVKNGNGNYKVTFENPLIAKVAYVSDNGKVSIVGKKNGRTTAIIEDAKGLKSAPIDILVNGSKYALQLGTDYYGYANFKTVSDVNPSATKSKQVTFEMTCYMTGYRGLQTFLGLENNLILRGPNDDYKPTHPIAIVGLNDGLNIESSYSFSLNQWMHIALVVDCDKTDVKEKYKLYINGVQDNLNFINTTSTHSTIDLASSGDNNMFVVGWATNQDWRRINGTV